MGSVSDGRIIDADIRSNFGLVMGRSRNEYLPTANHRTAIVILGDGHNNGKARTPEPSRR